MRSFSPSKPATIVFGNPLTLIVGPNGSGKTTIVECLKYCTTGLQPPNTKGGAFIFDPKLTNEFEVKAQVKIVFKNTNEKSMICVRSLLLTQKKTSVTQRLLESLLLIKDPESGKTYSLSSKCAELDVEIPLQLGVTRAILDNVVFCHQESTLWPMSESSLLKKKFDEIFSSTRYTKVLETIKAIRKEKQTQLILLSQSLEYLKKNRTAAEKIFNDKAQQEKRLEELKCKINNLDNLVLSTLAEKLKHTQDLANTASSLSQSLSKLKSEKHTLETLNNDFHNLSDENDVDNLINQKHSLLERLKDEQRDLNTRRLSNGKTLLTLRSSHSSMLIEQGRLKCQINNYDEAKNKITHTINSICNNDLNKISLPPNIINPTENGPENLKNCIEDTENIILLLKNKRADTQKCLSKIDNEISQLNDSLRSKVGFLQAQIMSLNEKLTSSNDQMKTTQAVVKEIEDELHGDGKLHDDDGNNSYHLELLNDEIDREETKLLQLSKDCNTRSTMEERRLISDKIIDLNNKLSETQSELMNSVKHNAIIDLQITRDETITAIENSTLQIDELVKKHNLDLQKDYESHLQDINDDINQLLRSKSYIEFKMKAFEEVNIMKGNLVNDAEPCALSYNQDEFNNKIRELEDKLMDKLREVFLREGESRVYRNLIEKFEEEEGSHFKCPLCHNDISDIMPVKKELLNLITGLEYEINATQIEVDEIKRELGELKDHQVTRKVIDLLAKCSSSNQFNVSLVELKGIEDSISNKYLELEYMKEQVKIYKHINDINDNVGQKKKNLLEINSKIGFLHQSIGISSDLLSAEQIVRTKNKLTDEIRQLTQTLADFDHAHNEQIDALAETQKILNLKRERRDWLQDRIILLKKHKSNIQSIVVLTQETNKHIDELNASINDEQAEASSVILNKKQAASIFKNDIAKFDKYLQELIDFQEIESKCVKFNIWNHLKFCNMEIIKTQDEINILNSSQDDISKKIEENITSVANVMEDLRRANEIKKHINIRVRIRELSRTIENDEAKFNEFNLESLSKTLVSLKNQNETLLQDRAMILGEIKQIGLNIKRADVEYSENYSEIDEQYSKLMIDYKTEEMVCKDLDKYYKALEGAIAKFHSHKMREINRSINELWTYTYKNADIDSIEIRSNVLEGNDSPRSYNYRVVMIKNGIEIDMRGRCSAGQKVLASVVIRLALAETFCFDCGFFALDEPTTNIDRDNVEGLAYCLLKLVEKKRRQKNFQLLIITHDEIFTQYFQRSGYSSGIWRVNKDMDGHSYIKHFDAE